MIKLLIKFKLIKIIYPLTGITLQALVKVHVQGYSMQHGYSEKTESDLKCL